MGQLTAAGHELTPRPDEADVIVVNTCSFIDPAKQESVDTILEMAEHKKTGRAKKLIVAGCLVERYRGDIQKDLPEVDALIGTNELEKVVALCQGEEPATNPFEPYLYHDLTPRVLSTPRHYAYIKISEGCDHPCSFCVIPQYRGANRSRRPESVVTEASRLFAQGIREINLIGQDTTAYGEDLGIKDGLAHLLTRLAQIQTPKPKWIRFLYAYPNRVSNKLLDTLAEHDSLVKYIDMPLQHASASVLKRMKRGASGEIFLKLLEKVRRTIPGVSDSHQLYCRIPRRDRSRLRRTDAVRRGRAVRSSWCLQLFRRGHGEELPSGRQGGWPNDRKSQAQAHGASKEDLTRQKPQTHRPGVPRALGWAVRRNRPALAGPHALAGARDRWRLLHQRPG